MRAVIADTSPINYLALVGSIEILPTMFGTIHVPESVWRELHRSETPSIVREYLRSLPAWITVRPDVQGTVDPALERLDVGEREAIRLAIDLILMDDRAGVSAARDRGFRVVGTLGVIELAAHRELLDVKEAVTRLQATSFRCRPELMQDVLRRHGA